MLNKDIHIQEEARANHMLIGKYNNTGSKPEILNSLFWDRDLVLPLLHMAKFIILIFLKLSSPVLGMAHWVKQSWGM